MMDLISRSLTWFNSAANQQFYGNPLIDWVYASALALITFAVLWLLRARLARRAYAMGDAARTRGLRLPLVVIQHTHATGLMALSIVLSSKYLELGHRADHLTTAAIILLLLWQAGIWAQAAVHLALEPSGSSATDRNANSVVSVVQFVARLVIWAVVLLLALDSLGFQIKTLLAGLGIGGIAVALSVQSVLGDLLASVSIALDKPFAVGDSLTLDNGYTGTVEAMSVKSTRLRSPSGEQLIISNAELSRARIRNFGRVTERRSVFHVRVAQTTAAADLALIPMIVSEACAGHPLVLFERTHFVAFGNGGLEFEGTFLVSTRDNAVFLDAQQAVFLGITRGFEKQAIRLASAPQSFAS